LAPGCMVNGNSKPFFGKILQLTNNGTWMPPSRDVRSSSFKLVSNQSDMTRESDCVCLQCSFPCPLLILVFCYGERIAISVSALLRYHIGDIALPGGYKKFILRAHMPPRFSSGGLLSRMACSIQLYLLSLSNLWHLARSVNLLILYVSRFYSSDFRVHSKSLVVDPSARSTTSLRRSSSSLSLRLVVCNGFTESTFIAFFLVESHTIFVIDISNGVTSFRLTF
jgi:hypothetical protein